MIKDMLLKSLIDKWQFRLECLQHKDRLDYADNWIINIYQEIIQDLQKLR